MGEIYTQLNCGLAFLIEVSGILNLYFIFQIVTTMIVLGY